MADTSNAESLRYFVDSNIIGYIVQGAALGVAYLEIMERLDDLIPSVSTTVVNEIEAGLARLDATRFGQRRLVNKMRDAITLFEVIDLDSTTIEFASKLKTQARRVGHPIGADHQTRDLEIAALAIQHRAPLVSHNYRDFTSIDALDLRTLAVIRKNPPRITHDFG